MKYLSLMVLFFMFSCGKKEAVLLPKSNVTLVADVVDHSSIYLFFKTNSKDTLVEVNRKNSIISTNWILNIDKRLPLRLVIPEIMKLQQKKREEKAHKNENAENYYAYADSIGKNMAFIPFTDVYYKMVKPNSFESFLRFKKDGMIQFYQSNTDLFSKGKLENFINHLFIEHESEIIFSFDSNMSFGEYLQNKILIEKLKITKKGIWVNREKEFIY